MVGISLASREEARNLFKRVHNDIHNVWEALPSQVVQVVAKSNPRVKGLAFCFQVGASWKPKGHRAVG